MKKSLKIAALITSTTIAAAGLNSVAQASTVSGYVQSANGSVVKDPFGLCWRTGFWTPALATLECDADLVPKPAAPAPAPAPVVSAPAPTPTPAPVPAPVAPVSEKVTFATDTLFAFDKAVLKPEGREKLDKLAADVAALKLEVVVAVGHTDNVGSTAYNQKLSVKRAEAVKAYLVSKGIEATRVYTEGKGEAQPIADNKTSEGRAKNRRVEIEVVGTRAKK